MSRKVTQFKAALGTLNERALVWVLVGAYIVLIALLAGASTLPTLSNPLVVLNDVVRGLIGG